MGGQKIFASACICKTLDTLQYKGLQARECALAMMRITNQ